jgi:SAM-dependent methyltransferase
MLASKMLYDVVNRTGIKHILTTNRFFVRAYFNVIYRRPDPYAVVKRQQHRKIEHAFSLVQGLRAHRALEIGCGEGRWAKYSAAVADQLTAIDISDLAIRRARAANQLPNVDFRQGDLVSLDIEPGSLGFVFCSEVLYYLTLEQLDRTVERVVALLAPGGKVLLVHARALKDDTTGLALKEFGAKTINERFKATPLVLEAEVVEDAYRIALFAKPGGAAMVEPDTG